MVWNRESNNELFDYETKNFSKYGVKLTEDCYIIQIQDKITSIPSSSNLEQIENSKVLLALTKSSKNFFIHPASGFIDKKLMQEASWAVVKGFKEPEYFLSQGDVIRLGKIILKVKEIKGIKFQDLAKQTTIHSKKINFGGLGGGNYNKTKVEKKNPLDICDQIETKETVCCRFCLGDDLETKNPLIKPCLCSGTMGTVHLQCLQKWLNGKISRTIEGKIKTYSWRQLECELCKGYYPSKILVEDTFFDLISIEKPDSNYIVFETESEGLKNLIIFSFEGKKNIRLGRGYETDLRLPDISVSRNHANIKIKSNGLYLEDLNSKFGTLVKLKKEICMDVDSKLLIQSGRVLFKISITKPWSLFGCLSGCSKGKDSDEEIQKFSRGVSE
jgi:RING-variant domain/FHA domain